MKQLRWWKVMRLGWRAVLYALMVMSFVAMVAVAAGWWRSGRGMSDVFSVAHHVPAGKAYARQDWAVASVPGALSFKASVLSGQLFLPAADYADEILHGRNWTTAFVTERAILLIDLKSEQDFWAGHDGATLWRWGGVMFVRAWERHEFAYLQPPVALEAGATSRVTVLFVPHWIALIVTGILPALGAWRIARWRRKRKHIAAGMCKGCGYDLRATPGRCPECGLEAASSA